MTSRCSDLQPWTRTHGCPVAGYCPRVAQTAVWKVRRLSPLLVAGSRSAHVKCARSTAQWNHKGSLR